MALNKICLVVKNHAQNILIVKTAQNYTWKFPYLYKNKSNEKLINSILKTVNECGIDTVMSINYLFEINKKMVGTNTLTISYYELLIQEKYLAKSFNNFFSLMRYMTKENLNILYNTSPAITEYLNIILKGL